MQLRSLIWIQRLKKIYLWLTLLIWLAWTTVVTMTKRSTIFNMFELVLVLVDSCLFCFVLVFSYLFWFLVAKQWFSMLACVMQRIVSAQVLSQLMLLSLVSTRSQCPGSAFFFFLFFMHSALECSGPYPLFYIKK